MALTREQLLEQLLREVLRAPSPHKGVRTLWAGDAELVVPYTLRRIPQELEDEIRKVLAK